MTLSVAIRWTMAFAALALFFIACGGNAETGGSSGADDDGTSAQIGGGGSGNVGGSGGTVVDPPACDMWAPHSQEPEIVIGPTGLQSKLVELMNGAQSEILLMMYQLSCGGCIDGLIAAKGRGVNVRVLLDGAQYVNTASHNQLAAAGIEVKDAPAEFNHAHAKVMIIDQQTALVMSANMNVYSMSSERNYGVINHDAQDIEDLTAIFERDWAGQGAVDTSCTRLIIGPENARDRILELIASAEQELLFEAMYITDDQVLSAIKAKLAQGVAVRVLFAHPEWIDSNVATATELEAAGAQTKYLYQYEVHAKMVIADGVAFVGSENFSWNSLTNNREVGMLVTEPNAAAQIKQQVETDWTQGVAAP
jgi:phosphatidylserine/phosphatidylglycerophosphate/cardiolipin synthase-like enzyme